MNADMKWLDNPEVFRVNQLDAHSDHCYYMDYADMEKSENPLMQSLNGQWEFAFSKNVMDRPENFYEENFDASSFDKIMVPGHIELAGYDKIRYINTMYPWEGKEYHRGAYSMESTGDEAGMFSEAEYNPVGSYIKRFDLSEQMREKKIRICFEGVEEAMYLWLNGQFVGYAEDSFTPSEFDLTPFIREKGNVLAVQVHKMRTHPGAVYLHRGKTYVVKSLDMAERVVRCEVPQQRVNWHTRVRSHKETAIIEVKASGSAFGAPVAFGRLRVTETITGYEQRSVADNRLICVVPLDLPPLVFETEGLWFCVPDGPRRSTEDSLMSKTDRGLDAVQG